MAAFSSTVLSVSGVVYSHSPGIPPRKQVRGRLCYQPPSGASVPSAYVSLGLINALFKTGVVDYIQFDTNFFSVPSLAAGACPFQYSQAYNGIQFLGMRPSKSPTDAAVLALGVVTSLGENVVMGGGVFGVSIDTAAGGVTIETRVGFTAYGY